MTDILTPEQIANLAQRAKWAKGLSPAADNLCAIADSHESLRAQVQALTEERDREREHRIQNLRQTVTNLERAEAAERLAAELHERVTEWQPIVNAYNANRCAEADPEGEAHQQRKRAEKAERLAAEREAENTRLREVLEQLVSRVANGRVSSIGSLDNTLTVQFGRDELERLRAALSPTPAAGD